MPGQPSSPARLWTLVPALGIAQIISWGSLYYAIAVLGQSMQHELGVSSVTLFGAFTLSLVVSGLAAPRIGRLIDARGARAVLPAGSLLAGASLLVLASASGPVTLLLGWALAGCAMAATLYDPVFAALSQIAGPRYRQALTALTLFGGFASTVFWPASQFLLDAVGWRETLMLYAGLHFLVCLPLHLILVPVHRGHSVLASAADTGTPRSRTIAQSSFFLLAAAFALASFTFSALSVHLIAMLKSYGLTPQDAVWIAALIGPMQVAGRIGEFTFGRRLRATTVGTIALALQIVALALLSWVPGPGTQALAFAAAYGCSNGIMTIARGAVPAELFGRRRYGELLGRFARVVSAATAAAPLAIALIMDAGLSYKGVETILMACAVVALLNYQLAIRRLKAPVAIRPA